ncbi:MAG: hypothetical protein ACI9O4_001687 [Chitinophagales bacterium]|jgi:hypothetical protein
MTIKFYLSAQTALFTEYSLDLKQNNYAFPKPIYQRRERINH